MTVSRELRDLLIEWGASKAEIAAIPRRLSMLWLLRAIEAEAKAVYGDAGAWLRWPNRSGMFRGRAPLLTVLEGEPGMLVVLGHLQRMERLGGRDIAPGTQPEVDGPTFPVNGTIQVAPLASDLHGCLVDPP